MKSEEAFILGVVLGDGCLTSREEIGDFTIEFDQKNKEWLEILSKKFENCFQKETKVRPTSKGFFRLRIHSKKIFGELQNKIKQFPENLSEADKNCKINFLRGMFDSEGSADKNKFRVRICSKDDKIINACKILLNELKIKTGKLDINKKTEVKSLPINGKDNLIKFQKIVGFTHPEKMKKLNLLISA